MKIIISPYSKKLRDTTNKNPKDYPYWKELIQLLKHSHTIIQVGTLGEEILTDDYRFNLKLKELQALIKTADLFISVDNFFHHFCHFYGVRGIVLFSKSDPKIFGYKENVNILKDKKYLRTDQFGIWESCQFDSEAFVSPIQIMEEVNKFASTSIDEKHIIVH